MLVARGCAPASQGPVAGRSCSIISIPFSHCPCKGEEEDAGLAVRCFLLAVQDRGSCKTEDPGVVLTTALSSKSSGQCRKPTAALPPPGWAQHLLGTALHLPPTFLVRVWRDWHHPTLQNNNPGAAGATLVAQFHKQRVVWQTSGTLRPRNRNLGD